MNQIPSIVFCLRTGGDYLPIHVDALTYQVEKNTTLPCRSVCYSDVEGRGYILLERNLPGWWSCVELWRHPGVTIVVGLDTLILGNMDDLLHLALNCKQDEFYLLDSPFHKGQFVNGIQIYNGDWSWLYENFDYEKESVEHRGDENYLIKSLVDRNIKIKSIQKEVPGILNYRKEFRNGNVGLKGIKILYFHGKPRPWQVSSLWRNANK